LAPPASREDRLFGAALMAIGGLIVGLCGACTFASFWMLLGLAGETGGPDLQTAINSAIVPLLIGGIPTVLGALLFRAGLRRYRGLHDRGRDRPIDPRTFD
jgi:hypothetical protein